MRIQYLGLSGLVHFARTLLTFAFAFLFVVQALTVCVAHPQEGNGNSGGNEDLSGDDVKDNVAGDPNADPSGMHHAGQVIVRSGVGNTLLATIRGGSIGDRFGASVATVGDVNLDGEIDLLVGATRAGGRGRVYLFNGPFKADDNGAIHVLDLSAADAAWVFNPNYLDDKDFGFAVAPLYDLDGDGFADLRIMSWAQQSDGSEVSRTYVYSGNQSLWSVTDGPFLVGTLDGAISWELWTPVIGDLDANGAIDSDDLIRLTANIGMTGTSNSRLSVLDGDLNLDNSVDATDLAILMDQFGFKAYADILPPGSNLHICGLVIGSGQTTGGVWCDGHQGTGNQHPGGTNNGGNGNGGNGNNGGGSGNGNGTGIGDGSGNCLKITTPNDSDVQCINTPVCMQAELSPGIYPPCDHVTWNVTDSAPGGQQQGGMTSGSATFDNGSSSTSLEPGEDACIIFDEPGEYVISGSYCGYCTGTKRLTVTNVELTPDPETHLDDTKITILPGDIENVTATYDVSPDKIWFKIVDSTIAEFKLDDGIYADTVAGSSSPQELHILGRANGDTILEAHIGNSTGEVCEALPIVVGGTIRLEYDQAPTFMPYTTGGGNQGGVAGGDNPEPPPSPPDAIVIGGSPLGSSAVDARHSVDPTLVQFISDTVPNRVCTMRIEIRDAEGRPKKGKEAVFSFEHGNLTISNTSFIKTGENGRALVTIRQNLADQIDPETGAIKENAAILIGEAARQFLDNEIPASEIASIRTNGQLEDHEFTGHSLKYKQDIVTTLGETYHTSVSLDMPILNSVHLAILTNNIEQQLYSNVVSVTGQTLQILQGFDEDGQPIMQPSAVTDSPLPFTVPAYIDAVTYELNPYLTQWYAAHAPQTDFSMNVAPPPADDPSPGWVGKVVTVSALAAEIAISLIPGGDLYDLFKEYIWGPIVNGTAPNNVTGIIAAIGFLFDTGYLAGAFGAAGNLVAGVVKAISKYLPEEVVIALMKMGGTLWESVKLLGDYLMKVPVEGGANIIEAAVIKAQGVLNQCLTLVHSTLEIGGQHVAEVVGLFAKKASRHLTDEAAEGAGLLMKLGRKELAEDIFEEFGEDVAERAFETTAVLAKRSIDGLSEEASRGVAVAVETVGHESGVVREFAEGMAINTARAESSFKNLNRLEGVEGLDEMVEFLRNNRNNLSGIDGVIFESTAAKEILEGSVDGAGTLIRVSADGLPNMNRIDTLTSTWAIQVKSKISGNIGLGDLGGGVSGIEYLDQLAQQATSIGKAPVLITNQAITLPLRAQLDARGIMWRLVEAP